MAYFHDHWQGRHALARSFWINFFLPFVLIAIGGATMRPPMPGGPADTAIVLLYLTFAYGIALPWQIIGLWRSSRRHLEERGDLGLVTFAQGGAVIGLVVALGGGATSMLHLLHGGDARRFGETSATYRMKLAPAARAVVIDGPFEVGLSRDLKRLLTEDPGIAAVILNSDGGRIFEARGVARQILENGLDTYVYGHCRSACTIAFMAGETRRLGEKGRLGFHSYGLNAVIAFVDTLEEQEKDKAFFRERGVDASFVQRAFATPHEEIWQPDAGELLRSGVVHETIDTR